MQSKIRICHICDRITGKADGVFAHLLMLFRNINNLRFEQIVIFQGGEVVENELKKLGIKFYIIPGLTKRISVTGFISIYKILKEEQTDIIHTHLIKPYILAGLINIFLKKKLIFNYHGLFIDSIFHSFFEKQALYFIHSLICFAKAVDIAIVPSKFSKQKLETETKLFSKIEIYYNGFDGRLDESLDSAIVYELKNRKTNSFLVGIIARLEIEKRIDLSLLILKELSESGYSVFFVFFGDGPLENEMKILSQNLGVNNKCKFYGFVEKASNYIKYFDTILFTSDREGLPLTYWEAMANSVPVISTDVGGAREILIENNCGLVYPLGNIDGGEKAITRLIEDETLRLILGENGRAAINEKYNANKFRKQVESIYNGLLST